MIFKVLSYVLANAPGTGPEDICGRHDLRLAGVRQFTEQSISMRVKRNLEWGVSHRFGKRLKIHWLPDYQVPDTVLKARPIPDEVMYLF